MKHCNLHFLYQNFISSDSSDQKLPLIPVNSHVSLVRLVHWSSWSNDISDIVVLLLVRYSNRSTLSYKGRADLLISSEIWVFWKYGFLNMIKILGK